MSASADPSIDSCLKALQCLMVYKYAVIDYPQNLQLNLNYGAMNINYNIETNSSLFKYLLLLSSIYFYTFSTINTGSSKRNCDDTVLKDKINKFIGKHSNNFGEDFTFKNTAQQDIIVKLPKEQFKNVQNFGLEQ